MTDQFQQKTFRGNKLFKRLCASRWADGFEGPYANCFAYLYGRLERRQSLRAVIDVLPHSEARFELTDLLNAMAHLGVYATKTALGEPSLQKIQTPALLVRRRRGRNLSNILVIEADENTGAFQIYDPISGQRHAASAARLCKGHEGELYLFDREKDERARNNDLFRKGAGYGWFRALIVRFYPLIAQTFALSLCVNVLGLAVPLYIMMVYDRVIALRLADTLPILTIGALLAVAAEYALRQARSARLSWIAARIDNIVGNLTFQKLVGLPLALAERTSVTAQVLRLRSFEAIREFFCNASFLTVLELPFVLIYIGAIALIAGPLAFAPMASIAAYLLLFVTIRKRIAIDMRRSARTGASNQRYLLETFSKTADIQTSGLSRAWVKKYNELVRREYTAFTSLLNSGHLAESLARLITMVGGGATLAVGAMMTFDGRLSGGGLIACLILTWKVLGPFHNVCAIIPRLEQLRYSIAQIDALMQAASSSDAQEQGAMLTSVRGEICMESAGIRHEGAASPSLSNINLHIKPGQLVAISGDSGAGKTTLLKMIMGVYPNGYGVVEIDGFNIHQLNARRLRRLISYIPQSPLLFRATIEENLRFAHPECSLDDIWNALERAGVAEEIKSLPKGVYTIIGEDRRLSHEMEMKVSLARAYLMEGAILLIDETPQIFTQDETGTAFRRYLKSCRGVRTTIIITQHPDILDLCDRVINLKRDGATERPRKANVQTGRLENAA